MMIKNTRTDYGVIFKVFHWAIALLTIALFLIGIYMVTLNYYHPRYHQSLLWHKSLGMMMGAILASKILWWLINPPPGLTSLPKWQKKLATITHLLLLLGLIFLAVSGYLIATSNGDPIALWSLVNVPATLIISEPYLNYLGKGHQFISYGLISLVALHVTGAFWHQVKGDSSIRRMLW